MTDQCTQCGKPILGKEVFISADLKAIFCKRCISLLGSCYTCEKAAQCAFEQDPSPLPKQVAQVIQQGNVTMQTIIRNPEREKITCQAGCPCWHEEWGCGRAADINIRCINNNWKWNKEGK